MFIIIEIQINITITVNQLNQYFNEFHKIHLQAAKYLLHYLKDKIDLKILYKIDRKNFIVFIDVVYANTQKFKSIIRFCILIVDDFII